MRALAAAAPPAVALALLLARVRPVLAAAGALATGVAALAAFDVDAGALARAEGRALATAVEVAAIILGGLLLFEVLARAGAQERIGAWLASLSADRARCALLVVLGVTPFTESVTGFGVGAIIAAPLLVRMGFAAPAAAVLALLGFVAVPWGALGPGTLVAARLAGLGFDQLGVETAALSLPVILVAGGAALVVAAGKAAPRRLPELLVVALALWAGLWLANRAAGTPLAGVLGSLVAVAAVLGLVWLRERRPPRIDAASARALAPYGLLVALLLGANLVLALAGAGRGGWRGFLASPVLWLAVTVAATPALLGSQAPALPAGTWPSALRRWWPVALTTVLFLALGGLMTASGMSAALAEAGARLGRGYLLAAPWVGGVGGFLTGSNAGANAMLAAAQADAARGLGLSPLRLVAVQNVAAALLTMASAPRVALVTGLLAEADPTRVLRLVLLVDVLALLALDALLAVLGA